MPRRWLAAPLLASVLAACSGPPEPAAERIELEPCWLGSPVVPARRAARCGTLSVPEDPEREGDRGARHIELRIAVVPAVSRTRQPDPLVFLTGGPGQAATESYVQLGPAFRRIERDRDIVLVDQRGTGGSNPLRCSEPEGVAVEALDETAIGEWVRACLAALDAEPRFYTTSDAVRDLEAVREALGYERINLYGASYGTRVALAYLREHGEHVRSVILDGVADPTENLGVDVARDAQRAFDALASRCRKDESCRAAFPRLEEDLAATMGALEMPVEVSLRHPTTGVLERIPFHRSEAATAIRLATYSVEKATIVPMLLRSAAEGDFRPLATQFLLLTDQLEASIANGMGFSVVCNEDYPFFEPEANEILNEGTYLGTVQTEALDAVCPIWPDREIPRDFKDAVTSDVPVLLLSGELDPVTPPENAVHAAETLSRSRHLVAPGQGHIAVHRGCMPRLAAEFVETADASTLDDSCLRELEPHPFFSSFAGPDP